MLSGLDFSNQKGYNKCITCEDLGIICDGPNFTAMSPERFCEWCRLRKEYLGWTNAHLVEVSGVSKTTVDRIMTGTATGLNGETKSRMTCALIYQRSSNGEAWGQYPCPKGAASPASNTDISRELAVAKQQLQELKANDQIKIDHLKEEIEFYKLQIVTKDRLLGERADYLRLKDRYIKILACAFAVALGVIVIALFADLANPEVGFIWREAMSAVVS